MRKTASEKSHPDAAASGAAPAEPLERARLQAEVAKQRVRLAKEELKRSRKRLKEAKREAKRARKLAVAARKTWKKIRRAHRGGRKAAPAPASAPARRRADPGARHRAARKRPQTPPPGESRG